MAKSSFQIKKVDALLPATLAAAQINANRGRFEEALAELHAALCENPELAPAHLLKGLIHWRRHEFAAARQSLELATRVDRDGLDAWHALSGVCRELKDDPAALSAIDEVLLRDAGNADAHLLRGELLLRLNFAPPAKLALIRALKLNPTLTRAHVHLARIAIMDSELPTAYHHVTTAIQLDTRHYDTSIEIGELLQQLDRSEEAQAHYRRLTREFPTRSAPFLKLAEIFLEMGNDLAAMPLLWRAGRIEPKNRVAAGYLADIYRRQGRSETAIELTCSAESLDRACVAPISPPEGDKHVSP